MLLFVYRIQSFILPLSILTATGSSPLSLVLSLYSPFFNQTKLSTTQLFLENDKIIPPYLPVVDDTNVWQDIFPFSEVTTKWTLIIISRGLIFLLFWLGIS